MTLVITGQKKKESHGSDGARNLFIYYFFFFQPGPRLEQKKKKKIKSNYNLLYNTWYKSNKRYRINVLVIIYNFT